MQLREIWNGEYKIDVETKKNPIGVPEEKERFYNKETIFENIIANNFSKPK